jgi:hypothetical protein
MNRLFNRLVSEATAPIGEMSVRLFKMAMLTLLAMSCLFAGAIFLTIGFFDFLEPLEGYAGAAFAVGGLYLVAALICIFVMARERPGKIQQAEAALIERKKIQPSQKAPFANTIDESVAPILDILHEAGMERERLALAASAEIAKQMQPFSLVAFAMVAGFILGRLLSRGNPSRR